MPILTYGMTAEIEISVIIKGDADALLRDLRRLRETGLNKRASINTLVATPGSKYQEPFTLPIIQQGDKSVALEHLNRLVKQTRVGPEKDRRLAAIIDELAEWSER